jgi:acetyl esterase/lipase
VTAAFKRGQQPLPGLVPLFLASAADDPLVPNAPGFGIVDQWKKAGGKAKLHYYQNGAHVFGAL